MTIPTPQPRKIRKAEAVAAHLGGGGGVEEQDGAAEDLNGGVPVPVPKRGHGAPISAALSPPPAQAQEGNGRRGRMACHCAQAAEASSSSARKGREEKPVIIACLCASEKWPSLEQKVRERSGGIPWDFLPFWMAAGRPGQPVNASRPARGGTRFRVQKKNGVGK